MFFSGSKSMSWIDKFSHYLCMARGARGAPVHHQTMNTQGRTVMYARGGRKRKVLDVDLNDAPPNGDHEQVEGPLLSLTHAGQLQAVDHNQLPVVALTSGSSPPVLIDVEELDDDVIISSPRAFEQARNGSRIIARTSVIDVESWNQEHRKKCYFY